MFDVWVPCGLAARPGDLVLLSGGWYPTTDGMLVDVPSQVVQLATTGRMTLLGPQRLAWATVGGVKGYVDPREVGHGWE